MFNILNQVNYQTADGLYGWRLQLWHYHICLSARRLRFALQLLF